MLLDATHNNKNWGLESDKVWWTSCLMITQGLALRNFTNTIAIRRIEILLANTWTWQKGLAWLARFTRQQRCEVSSCSRDCFRFCVYLLGRCCVYVLETFLARTGCLRTLLVTISQVGSQPLHLGNHFQSTYRRINRISSGSSSSENPVANSNICFPTTRVYFTLIWRRALFTWEVQSQSTY